MTNKYFYSKGFSLLQLMVCLAIIAVLMLAAYPSFSQYRHQRDVEAAKTALLENVRFLEQHFREHHNFTLDDQHWPALPHTQTDAFCIKMQGRPFDHNRSSHAFTMLALAKDERVRPRALSINESGTMLLCDSSSHRCGDGEFFSGDNNPQRQCRLVH